MFVAMYLLPVSAARLPTSSVKPSRRLKSILHEKTDAKSLARPGGNLTGMFLDIPEMSGKQVGLLKEMVPRLAPRNLWHPGPQFAAIRVDKGGGRSVRTRT
jgi:hypothetical protein